MNGKPCPVNRHNGLGIDLHGRQNLAAGQEMHIFVVITGCPFVKRW
ncbi:MAG: hypothetical protein WC749_06135 [Dehalococcoidia bacterium]